MPTIVVRCTREEFDDFMRELPGVFAGRSPDRFGLRKALLTRLAHAALEDIGRDYQQKSQGQVGEDGRVWAPLSPVTVTLRLGRHGSGTTGQPGRGGESQDGWRVAVQQRRAEIYRELYRRLRAGGVPVKEARKQAAATAAAMTRSLWEQQKAVRDRGKVGQAGDEEDQDAPILVDTGRLLASASAGELSGTGLNVTYSPQMAQASLAGDQELDFSKEGSVTVWSNVPYGSDHMVPGRGTVTGGYRPPRPWTYADDVIPDEWKKKWTEKAAEIIRELIPEAFKMWKGAREE